MQSGTYLTPEERWDIVTKIPECVEHNRLCRLQEPFFTKIDALVKQLAAINLAARLNSRFRPDALSMRYAYSI